MDWIYNATGASGNAILTAADKATIRHVFMMWANDCLNASTTGDDHPSPVSATNSLQLLPNNLPYRMAANNYYLGHARLLTMMSLVMDPADDPPAAPGVAPSQLGNTLRSYILDATGAWLYQEFAMYGDPSTAASAYGVPNNAAGFGLASGGLPPEGMLYGHSYGFLLGQLLALQTAGFNSVSYSGPQIQLIGAPMWDRYVTGFISSLTPTPQTFASESWLGPVYQFASYGDLLRQYVTPDFTGPFALLAMLDRQNGSAAHLNAARWFSVNATEGGPAALTTRITQPWSWSTTLPILYYILLDPAAPPATDPRPGFPAFFFDLAAGRILAHSDWTAAGTMLDYRASWISINHQLGDGGQFELLRKGEWLTKEMSNYDNNALGMTTVYHNTLALQNWSANGNAATETLASGQQLFVQTLLPRDASLTARYAAGDLNPIAELEPTRYILTIQDPALPIDTRFLHVVQGADAGAAVVPALYLKASSGTAFDGATFGTTAAWFPVSATTPFTGTTLPAPNGVHTILVTGLTPNGSYGASVSGNVVTIVAAGSSTADAAGVLRLTF